MRNKSVSGTTQVSHTKLDGLRPPD